MATDSCKGSMHHDVVLTARGCGRLKCAGQRQEGGGLGDMTRNDLMLGARAELWWGQPGGTVLLAEEESSHPVEDTLRSFCMLRTCWTFELLENLERAVAPV